MAKSLKEALLEKFADLQELGIAPTTAPPLEDEGPAVVVEMGPDSYGESGGRRQRINRGGAYDDDRGRGGDVPIRPRGARRGRERGERGRGGPPTSGERFRRPDRGGERAALEGLPPPLPSGGGPRPGPRPPFGDRPAGPRPPFGDRPAGPRPPFGDRGPGGPRPPFGDRGPGGPPRRMGGPPQMGTTERLQRNAEQKQREAGLREELMGLLASVGAVEATPEAYDKFLADLTVETGALPPLDRVVEAVKLANSIEAPKVGNAVRQLFRRPRPRPAGPAPSAPIRPAGADAPAAPAAPSAPEPEPATSS
jgi:hypothetical protein